MGLFAKLFQSHTPAQTARANTSENSAHFSDFVQTRTGVRAFYEAQTTREPAAILLVAADGEWTRRTVADFSQAQKVAQKLEIQLFDVARSGYPREMRQWNIKQAQRHKR